MDIIFYMYIHVGQLLRGVSGQVLGVATPDAIKRGGRLEAVTHM